MTSPSKLKGDSAEREAAQLIAELTGHPARRKLGARESGGVPAAANPRSSARGCGQLLLSLHGWRFTAVGCSPAQWADPDCNVKAMLHLYREAGTSPWSL